jgi:hypothetical protein
VPPTVLAQIVDSDQSDTSGADTTGGAAAAQAPQQTPPAAGQAEPLDIPPSDEAGPLDTPAAGRNQPLDTSVTDPDGTDGTVAGQDTALGTQDAGIGDLSAGTRTGFGPSVTVGTLTVDQSGTGRLQQVVDGVQVQHVVGQAIVIYSQQVPPGTTLPPNLNVGAAPAGRPATGQPGVANQLPANQSRGGRGLPPPASNRAGSQTLGGGPAIGAPMPVAAGIIRLISDRRPNDDVGTGQQPAASLPATGQELR